MHTCTYNYRYSASMLSKHLHVRMFVITLLHSSDMLVCSVARTRTIGALHDMPCFVGSLPCLQRTRSSSLVEVHSWMGLGSKVKRKWLLNTE